MNQIQQPQSNSASQRVLTRHEAAQLFRVSVTTFDNWRKSGLIPFVKLGRSIRFPITVIEKCLAKTMTAQPTND